MSVLGIIPSRYGSTRFPGKPLADIQGKTLIRRVYEQASRSKKLDRVVVATDDSRILEHVKSFGGEVYITSGDHKNGTERCNEIVNRFIDQEYKVVVNIQGDEPFIDPGQIDAVADLFNKDDIRIGSLASKIESNTDIFNRNVVKVVMDYSGKAIYFSRSPIPFIRNKEERDWLSEGIHYRHIGIYAYTTETLGEIAALPTSKLELAESLEQLRWMQNGYDIHIAFTDKSVSGIDHPDDLLKITNMP
jgi:3-deoxy-manno-octulosonate cytidylyltransferase (CMP-KDO synthetase)